MFINSNRCIMALHLYMVLVILAVLLHKVSPRPQEKAATLSTSGRTPIDQIPLVSKPYPLWNSTELIDWQYFFRYKGQDYRDFLRICPRHLTHCRDKCRHGKMGGPKFNGVCVGQKCVCIRDPDLKLLHHDEGYAEGHLERLWRRVSPIIDNVYTNVENLNNPAKVLLIHYLRNLRRTVPLGINPNEKFEVIDTTEPYHIKTVVTERATVVKE